MQAANDNPLIDPKTRLGRLFENYLDFVPRITLIGAFAAVLAFGRPQGPLEWALLFIMGSLVASALVIETWSRMGSWSTRRAYAWISLTALAMASVQVSSSLHEYRHYDLSAFQNALGIESTRAAIIGDLVEGGYEARFVGIGMHEGKRWAISSWHDEADSNIQIEFSDSSACRYLLSNARPFLGNLSYIDLGGERFEGWPRAEILAEACARNMTLVYASQGTP